MKQVAFATAFTIAAGDSAYLQVFLLGACERAATRAVRQLRHG